MIPSFLISFLKDFPLTFSVGISLPGTKSFCFPLCEMSLFPLVSGRIVSSSVEFVDVSSCITAPENLLFVEMPGEAEARLGNSTESIHYPTSLGDDSGQDTVSAVFILPHFGEFEMIHNYKSCL